MATPAKAAHTPGPWEARKSHYSNHLSTIFGADGSYVAVTDNSKAPVGTPEKYEANARLIAAAPDLLAVAEEISAWETKWPVDRIYSMDTTRTIAAEMTAIVARARAAISRAEGRP